MNAADITLCAETPDERFAAELLARELQTRTGVLPVLAPRENAARADEKSFDIIFAQSAGGGKDCYVITNEHTQNKIQIRFAAQSRRGFIYAVGMFLRNITVKGETIALVRDIAGSYAPRKSVRGHQLGYRGNNNTYDAWTPAQFRRYCLDLMFFGMNTVEHVPDEGNNESPLMRIPPNDLLIEASKICEELDLDLCIWYPINSCQPIDEAAAERKAIFASLPRLDAVFIPGADPGDLPPKELFARVTAYSALLKEAHPNATMWVSAQMPHNAPTWPAEFLKILQSEPEGLDGVIIGPNHAFGVEELRRACPARYAYRIYPDITHNVRCEYPVHYEENDWHYVWASTLSRESVNPRPREFRKLYQSTQAFLCGGVSYSEGVHDDANKFLWSDFDYFGTDYPLRRTLEDYARLFYRHSPADAVADGLLLLEQNWAYPPDENPVIAATLDRWAAIYDADSNNWRVVLHYFRALCDYYVSKRREIEQKEVDSIHARLAAIQQLEPKARTQALSRLEDDARAACKQNDPLRDRLFTLAQRLFDLIGIQLDVRHFGGKSWERGCTLDTIDQPITNLPFLLHQIKLAKETDDADAIDFNMPSRTEKEEFRVSFALDGLKTLGCQQEGEFYLDFQGDKPANDGTLPMSLLQVYDHFTLRARLGGFAAGEDYLLIVTYFKAPHPNAENYAITANGHTIYRGKSYGGTPRDCPYLPKDYHAFAYPLPAGVFENGCLELFFSEPLAGIKISAFQVVKAKGSLLFPALRNTQNM
ncbi:MAG: hypothetical protein LBB67_01765 [Oscillospiraceae bacterium]|nr:hypothetical protein [Oscillospiraceae bacterium]